MKRGSFWKTSFVGSLFIAFMNYEGVYLVKGFLCNLDSCFDDALTQLWVIKKNSLEIAVAGCYLIITDLQNKKSKKQLFRVYLFVKLFDVKLSIKYQKVSSYQIFFVVSLSNHSWLEKQNLLVSWTWTCSQLVRKLTYWEYLLLFWMTSIKARLNCYYNAWSYKNKNKNMTTTIILNIISHLFW